MKWPVIIGGVVVSGTVAAGVLYSGTLQASADRGLTAPPATAKASTEPATTRQASVPATRGARSPKTIVVGDYDSPAAVKAAFKAQGNEWALDNLQSFPTDQSGDCPGGSGDAPERTLYVRYVTDYPSNPNGQPTLLYTTIAVPEAGGGQFEFATPNITEKIIRDEFEWKRTYQTRWWAGTDEAWLAAKKAERDRLEEQFMEAQDSAPMQAVALSQKIAQLQMEIQGGAVQSLNRTTNDIVEVEAPHTHWSFKYDNDTKKGDPLYRREAQVDYEAFADRLSENADTLVTILDPVRQFGENIEQGGTRTILGYTCQVQRAAGWDAEACMADVDGQQVSLWTRIDRAESTAVHINPQPCVPLAQFMPPPDVEFDEEW